MYVPRLVNRDDDDEQTLWNANIATTEHRALMYSTA